MTRSTMMTAAVLAALAGSASAQTLDGVKDASYGNPLWVNTIPTSLRDNNPTNIPPPGNPANVQRGVEFKIPLAAIGNPAAADIKIGGFVASGDQGFLSNQVIGGLGGTQGNLGEPRTIDFNTITTPANQFITGVTDRTGLALAPAVDGGFDGGARYGTRLFTQTTFTQFGDATHGNIDAANCGAEGAEGSEIDNVYAVINNGFLYVFVGGNLEANGNKLTLFIDSVAGGQNRILLGNSESGNFARFSDDGTGNGLTFDTGFEPDYAVIVNGVNTASCPDRAFTIFADWVNLPTIPDGTGFFLGSTTYGSNGVLSGGDLGAPAVEVTIDNRNVQGVTGTPPFTLPDRDFAVGSEINAVYGQISGGRLWLLVTGNLQTNFTKLQLFFDVRSGGQNTLLSNNVDIGFGGGIRRMGQNGGAAGNPGLTFDTAFSPDYWISYNTGNLPIQHFADATILRTAGPNQDLNGNNLDYGSFDGGNKIAGQSDPILFAGPRLDNAGNFPNQVYSNYGPRTASANLEADPNNPAVPPNGLLQVTLDNSNIAGITDTSGTGGELVTTGLELSIDLAELGWDNTSDIKVAGFLLRDGGWSTVSNQVFGGLPAATDLGEVAQVNFANIAGTQFLIVPQGGDCFADCDDNGTIDINDFFCFLALYASNDPRADCDGQSGIDINDFFCFLSRYASNC